MSQRLRGPYVRSRPRTPAGASHIKPAPTPPASDDNWCPDCGASIFGAHYGHCAVDKEETDDGIR